MLRKQVYLHMMVFFWCIGIRKILQERHLWDDSLQLNCRRDPTNRHQCCAVHLLQNQPDFKYQQSTIAEIVEKEGHFFELYPKFHCECNWIERYWSDAKREARTNCDYSFKSLRDNLESYLDNCCPPNQTPTKIRRYFKRCYRYIDAYSKGHDIVKATELVKQFSSRVYTSHRRVPLNG
jgi:hypothetical protein